MANKRMFTLKVVDSDAFLDMPLTTQCLYFHLNMRADDDGFISNPNRIKKLIGASDDDLKLLIAKKFVLVFESGVIVIKHWRMHNTLSKSRYSETVYTDEKKMLHLKDNKAYSFDAGCEINDVKLIEMSQRQMTNNRRTIDEQKTHPDLDLDLDKELDIEKEKNKKEKEDASASNAIATNSTESFRSIINNYSSNQDLVKVLWEFKEMRDKMKGFTKKAMKNLLNKLDTLATDDLTKIEIVNQSINSSWKGFYPLSQPKVTKGNNRIQPVYHTQMATNVCDRNKLLSQLKEDFERK